MNAGVGECMGVEWAKGKLKPYLGSALRPERDADDDCPVRLAYVGVVWM